MCDSIGVAIGRIDSPVSTNDIELYFEDLKIPYEQFTSEISINKFTETILVDKLLLLAFLRIAKMM
jgi:hypothetical protein